MISLLLITRGTTGAHDYIDIFSVALVHPEGQCFGVVSGSSHTIRRFQRIIDMAISDCASYVTKATSEVAVMTSRTHDL